jgi:hypothetical protein
VLFRSVFEMMEVFTGRSPPPNLFNFSDISVNGTLLVPGQILAKASGMGAWSVLMVFVMWSGGKIASLGVNLLREVKVEIKGGFRTVEEGIAKTPPKQS